MKNKLNVHITHETKFSRIIYILNNYHSILKILLFASNFSMQSLVYVFYSKTICEKYAAFLHVFTLI